MSDKKNSLDDVIHLIDYLIKVKKSDLKRIKNILLNTQFPEDSFYKIIYHRDIIKRRANKYKLDVIGSLPFLLLNKKYFPTTESLLKFAKTSGIHIPKGHKSRAEILGIIITNVAKLDEDSMSQFREALNQMLQKTETKEIDNFFLEWEKTIRSIKFEKQK